MLLAALKLLRARAPSYGLRSRISVPAEGADSFVDAFAASKSEPEGATRSRLLGTECVLSKV